MASICKEIIVAAPPDAVWDAVRDVGQVHRRMAPGFVTHSSVEGGERSVTFASGLTVRELIVDIDDTTRRFSYAVVGGQPTHHNASFQVFPYGEGHSRIVWLTDVLPHGRRSTRPRRSSRAHWPCKRWRTGAFKCR